MRILAACKNCYTQYDVSGQKAGDSLRCRCGGLVIVPEPRVAEARLARCSSCGGSRGAGMNCEFCGARFSSVDKGWGTVCPGCYCRLPNDAQFCVECGLKINPQTLNATDSAMLCPRCTVGLQGRHIESIALFECAGCAGMWLPAGTFEAICQNKETMGVAARGLGRGKSTRFELTAAEAVKYVPCPQCKNLMNRRNFAGVSGVIIDTCRDCGVWLDNQELSRIVRFIEAGGMDKARDVEARDRAHAERMREKHPAEMWPVAMGDQVKISGQQAPEEIILSTMIQAIGVLGRAFLKK
jgi:Zn-finger nucleic acid-binding protein